VRGRSANLLYKRRDLIAQKQDASPDYQLLDCPYPTVELNKLSIDLDSPRSVLMKKGLSLKETIAYYDEHFDLIPLANSMKSRGFDKFEALLVAEENDQLVVIDGNRRLCAALALSDKSLRPAENLAWDDLTEVPLRAAPVYLTSRKAAMPILGFRHFSGVQTWWSDERARWFKEHVDQGKSFKDLAMQTGVKKEYVAALYRNQCLIDEASKDGVVVEDPERYFTIWNNFLNYRGTRRYLGIPAPEHVRPRQAVYRAHNKAKLEKVIDLIYGRPHLDWREGPRQLSQLLEDPDSRQRLESGQRPHHLLS
jgi:hypothetical protein